MAQPREVRIVKIMEIAWLVISVASMIFGVYETAISGIGEGYMLFIFTLAAGIMYGIRRKQRIRLESNSKDE